MHDENSEKERVCNQNPWQGEEVEAEWISGRAERKLQHFKSCK
jgi:hypothetical protein